MDVRRSGRSRILSSRFKDMELTMTGPPTTKILETKEKPKEKGTGTSRKQSVTVKKEDDKTKNHHKVDIKRKSPNEYKKKDMEYKMPSKAKTLEYLKVNDNGLQTNSIPKNNESRNENDESVQTKSIPAGREVQTREEQGESKKTKPSPEGREVKPRQEQKEKDSGVETKCTNKPKNELENIEKLETIGSKKEKDRVACASPLLFAGSEPGEIRFSLEDNAKHKINMLNSAEEKSQTAVSSLKCDESKYLMVCDEGIGKNRRTTGVAQETAVNALSDRVTDSSTFIIQTDPNDIENIKGPLTVKVISGADHTIEDATVEQNEDGELVVTFVDTSKTQKIGDPKAKVKEDGMVECAVKGCGYSTNNKGNWYKHKNFHTGRNAHPCPLCPYIAKTTSNLRRHQMIHYNIKSFQCHICKTTFRQKIHLERHIKYKHEVKKVQCAYCDYRCANVSPDLQVHMKRRHLLQINEAEARVVCSCQECGFVAASKRDLAQHMKFHRPGPELKLYCEHCSFVTDCISRLHRHGRVHTKEKPYQCGLCDYRASQKEHVVRHMKCKHNVEAERTNKRKLHSLFTNLDISYLNGDEDSVIVLEEMDGVMDGDYPMEEIENIEGLTEHHTQTTPLKGAESVNKKQQPNDASNVTENMDHSQVTPSSSKVPATNSAFYNKDDKSTESNDMENMEVMAESFAQKSVQDNSINNNNFSNKSEDSLNHVVSNKDANSYTTNDKRDSVPVIETTSENLNRVRDAAPVHVELVPSTLTSTVSQSDVQTNQVTTTSPTSISLAPTVTVDRVLTPEPSEQGFMLDYSSEDSQSPEKIEMKTVPSNNALSLVMPDDAKSCKMFACPLCKMNFSKMLNFHKHLALQHKIPKALQSLSCCVCDYQTTKKSNLLVHMRKHNLPQRRDPSQKSPITYQKSSATVLDTQPTVNMAGVAVYNCVQCKYSTPRLENLYAHIGRRHQKLRGDGVAVCVVDKTQQEPKKENLQTVMVEMWPGSPAQPVFIENPPPRQSQDNNMLDSIQAMASESDEALGSSLLSMTDTQAVILDQQQPASNIQVPAEQLMQLSSGDYIEIDGEMYKVEFTEESNS